jgi:anti-sigma B factor antagonist
MSFAVPQFELTEDDVDDRTLVVAVRGEIHVSTAPGFSQRLGRAIGRGKMQVVLDLSEVAFIDSTGLSVLLSGLRDVSRRQGRLALAISNPTVLRLFEITGLDATFDIAPTREQALTLVRTEG